ncbi:hypothetical protein ACFVMC_31040 [Nocardia sp. NPDC127579]|uniref:hypothetical protein n=1 Tax=Nocardia sp. NPDC127579 TaxID=3345402 RepID=UPI00363CB220
MRRPGSKWAGLVAAVVVAVGLAVTTCVAADPEAANPARLVLFEQVGYDSRSLSMEISEADQLERFLTELAPATAASARAAVLDRDPSHRAFGFIRPGCRENGAHLTISEDRLEPVLTGGENIACARAEYFLAVFTVPAESVPPNARVG